MIKRVFDFLLAFILLILLSPLMLIIFCLIKLESKGPGFFKQERVGMNGKLFVIYKFRTMRVNETKESLLITTQNDPRILYLGKILRKYKLDELPQLINIIKGNMSFVGPRPEVPKYFQYYSAKEKQKILSIRPGLTDIASIKFKNESEFLSSTANPEATYIHKILPIKKKYYNFYICKKNFCFDLYLIASTIKSVFSQRNN